MEEREYILTLYGIYKNLLSTKEREYFEYYYFEDLSLQEIADNYSVSKAYVGKYINSISKKLSKYEECLNINFKNTEIKKLIKTIDEETRIKIENIIEK